MITIDMLKFGAKFANMTDKEQADFFKGMSRELQLWDSRYRAHMQFTYVAALMNNKDIDYLINCLSIMKSE